MFYVSISFQTVFCSWEKLRYLKGELIFDHLEAGQIERRKSYLEDIKCKSNHNALSLE
jgi:hypothetical protein